MKKTYQKYAGIFLLFILFFTGCIQKKSSSNPIPQLKNKGGIKQLIVDGNPFLILGGELHNSSSSSLAYMNKIWPVLDSSYANTILAAVEWSLIEPEEGDFDFSLLDGLLDQARDHNKKLILLWFGAWKNGQSHYCPAWVKKDFIRFPKAKTAAGQSLEIISPFSDQLQKADQKAYTALLSHISEYDSVMRTVIMVQIENEVGILGAQRDYSETANKVFSAEVPGDLILYLENHKADLYPGLLEAWSKNGFRTKGNWEEVFGRSSLTNEIFMAWEYAEYIEKMAAAGKKEYPLPVFVNAWIVQPRDKEPGDYPSGGPQAHLLDVWKAAAPSVDLFCPDIYLPDFEVVCNAYTRNNNTLFIPESRAGDQGAAQLIYAIGRHKAIGYSPFGIESVIEPSASDPLVTLYNNLNEMAPVILKARQEERITAVMLRTGNSQNWLEAGNYSFHVQMIDSASNEPNTSSYGYLMVITENPDEFIMLGKNVQVTFSPVTPGPSVAAILYVEEGKYSRGIWKPRRRLNGDAIMVNYNLGLLAAMNQTGTGLKFSGYDRLIQRVKLYRYP
jgi:hypothetical protein